MEVTRNGPVLVLRGGDLCVHVRPGRGGRIDRLFHGPSGGFQPVFVSGTACRTPRPGDAFEEHDTCGLDDGFPTLLRETVELPDGPVVYPDHGEIWSTPMEWRQDGDALTLFMESRLLPYQYEKTLHLKRDCLHLHWRIRNTGRYAFPCLWTFHGLFRYSPDLRVRLPESDGNGALCTCANPRLGPEGTRLRRTSLLEHVPEPVPPTAEKFWLLGRVRQGRCALEYPAEGMAVVLTYDPAQLPYLGFWVTAGGFKGEYNCALEPSTGWYDSADCARRQGCCPVLEPGQEQSFSMTIRVCPLTQAEKEVFA